MLLWWKRPDILLHASGVKTWELRANSPRGQTWMHDSAHNNGGDIMILQHDAAIEVVFRAIRDGLIVCSDPT